jgi:4-hydroxy-3-methylbut-2-enyl diphosphate reductase
VFAFFRAPLHKVHVEGPASTRKEFIMIGWNRKSRGTMGQLDSGIHLVEDVADVARIAPLQTENFAVVNDHAECG